MAAWRDEFELLCERCGYVVEGLPREGNCPECGRSIESSLPGARAGSPWQRGPGVASWIKTAAQTLRSPRRLVRNVQIEARTTKTLRRTNTVIASGLVSVVPAAIYYMQLLRAEAPYIMRELTWDWADSMVGWLGWSAVTLAGFVVAWLTLVILTKIESSGIRLYGRVHKTRITPTVALALTAHASIGWVVSGVLVSAGFGTGLGLYEIAMHRNVDVFRGVMMLAPIWMPVLGGLVGLLTFEMIVYLGVRGCRFANRTNAAE